MSGILGTAITGLMAFQRSLETTSHNITNVNTEGYSRQRVDLVTKPEQMIGAGYLGQGVSISNITRSYDDFITTQLRSSTSAFGDVDKYNQLSQQVDNLLADSSVGMEPAIKSFFNSVNDATNDPSSIPARQVMLSEAEIVSGRFGAMNGQFEAIRDQINTDMVVMTDRIGSLSATIADLNVRIASEQGRPTGSQQPNDLLDKRDTALNNLAELVDISVVPSTAGMVSVFMGKGLVLVLDENSNKVVTQPSEFDPTHMEIGIKSPSGNIDVITNQVTGGELAGTLRFRDEILDPAQQNLGRIAASIVTEFNAIHKKGFDLDGDGDAINANGSLFFKALDIPETPSPNNTGGMVLTATFDENNIDKIDSSDYKIEMTATGPNTYRLTRLADNTSFNLEEGTIQDPAFPSNPLATLTALVPVTTSDKLPGINLVYDNTVPAAVGDTFFIRPTYTAASDIEVNLTDPRDIALATNIATDSNGVDYFINGPMPGDNRNGLSLASLENKLGMANGTASFQSAYGALVSEVGVLTNAAKVGAAAQETLLNNSKEAWGNVSGVNLDEEAANLIKFQQSYQAAAQMVSVSNTLFDALLGAVN
ncbi:MAG: flagellar hook-associated protein FlgK [Methylococcales bacterium]|nr:flagellar hook-associated protein FlgK [Methylococcales bacterium]